MTLVSKKCVPCEGGTPPLTDRAIETYITEVPHWHADGNRSLSRGFMFKNFTMALEFVNKVGAIAEEEGHHPDINLYNYSNVLVTLSTHAIKGLSDNDFIIAAKIDRIEK